MRGQSFVASGILLPHLWLNHRFANSCQVVYYQAGVGTGIGMADQLLGGGTGMATK